LGVYWSDVVWPWLEANKHLPHASKNLEGHNLVAAAAARLVLGERDEAVRLVKNCVASFEGAIRSQSAIPENVELLTAQLKSVRDWAATHNLS